MRTFAVTIELRSYWHAGTGLGRGADADALVLRDRDGLPHLPGKSVKGLLREGMQLAEDFGRAPSGTTVLLFGAITDNRTPASEGSVQVDDASLSPALTTALRQQPDIARAGLFSTISSTAMTDNGVAKDHTLRTHEVAAPVMLWATLRVEDTGVGSDIQQRLPELLSRAAALTRSLGVHRHRGLGRCMVRVEETTQPPAATSASPAAFALPKNREQWLQATLLSPVVVTARMGTTGQHETLDYLPGSVFLGAAARALRPGWDDARFCRVFLGGAVRFGDGLPLGCAVGAPTGSGEIGWPVPGCWFTPKLKGELKEVVCCLDGHPVGDQPQQVRVGCATAGHGRFRIRPDYLLKTAVDRDQFGRTEEEKLYGYESLPAGSVFRCRASWEQGADADAEAVLRALLHGPVRLGRSRSAQYGRVQIGLCAPPPPLPPASMTGERMAIYLASDLALEQKGMPVLSPRLEDFGLERVAGARFLPEASQIRTRRYAPWNDFWHTRDTERFVLGRGSVLVFHAPGVDSAALQQQLNGGVGRLRHEGLGCVQVHPGWVVQPPSKLVEFSPASHQPGTTNANLNNTEQRVLDMTVRHERSARLETLALALGRQWAGAWIRLHQELDRDVRLGASQWSLVCATATRRGGDIAGLRTELLDFFQNGLRSQYWLPDPPKRGDAPPRIGDHVLKALHWQGVAQPSQLATMPEADRHALAIGTLVIAASQMARKLQRRQD
ncbi:MAG: hypothetical protein HY735_35605 [Verrucomicrobia bacterium]|nr:hypothetical protein [Verrucomicrobiota bacterium]